MFGFGSIFFLIYLRSCVYKGLLGGAFGLGFVLFRGLRLLTEGLGKIRILLFFGF